MKFTDGYWQLRQGVTMLRPAEAYDVTAADGRLTIYAPARPVGQRADTLNNALLTVELWSPRADVIGVRLTHFAGGLDRGPHFELAQQTGAARAAVDDEWAALTSGRLAARVPRHGGWRIDFLGDGQPLTTSPARGMGHAQVDGEGAFTFGQLTLGVGECVYGLGERFTAFVKNGQVVEIWNKDGGTGSDQAYKSGPVLSDQPRLWRARQRARPGVVRGRLREGHARAVQPARRVAGVLRHRRPDAERRAGEVHRAHRPPRAAAGLVVRAVADAPRSRPTYDEATVTSFIEGMAERDLPLHVFHFDCFWMREFNWCDFEWDPRTFPDPAGMLRAAARARAARSACGSIPYIAQRSPLFAEGQRARLSAAAAQRRTCGRPTSGSRAWPSSISPIRPRATWYADKLRALMAMGVDCFKTDFGERIPTDVVYHDGSDPAGMHNYYTLLYNQSVFETLRRGARRGRGGGVRALGHHRRPALPGALGRRLRVDLRVDGREPARRPVAGAVRASASGATTSAASRASANAPVYKRWIAFGLLSSHSRLHGSRLVPRAVAVRRRSVRRAALLYASSSAG